MRRIAADAVIVDKGRVLFIRRGHAPFKCEFALPGGMLEQNETLEQCAVREVHEETGLKVKPVRLIGIYSSPKRDPRGTVSAAFECKVVGGKLKAGSDASCAEWLPPHAVKTLAFDHLAIINDWKKVCKK